MGNRLEGTTTLGNGFVFNWAFEPIKDTTSKSDEKDEDKKEPDSLFARLTYPNMAFGNETAAGGANRAGTERHDLDL